MMRQWTIYFLSFLVLTGCDRLPIPAREGFAGVVGAIPKSTAGPPAPSDPRLPKGPAVPVPAPLPPQVADGAAPAALVWSAPPPDEDFYGCGEAGEDPAHPADHDPPKKLGENAKDLGAMTYWVVPAGGTGAWTVVARRPGLFVAVGDRVLEARSTRVSRDIRKPPPPPIVLDDGTKDWECGAPYPEGIPLEVRGSGLVLRELGGKREHPVVPAPKDYKDVEPCVQQLQWWVEPVGGVGRFLFLNHRTTTTVMSTHLHKRFLVFDLERMAPVEDQLLPEGTGGWRTVVDDPSWRPELHKRFRRLFGELKLELKLEPDLVYLSHLWPLFPASGGVGLELAFRHEYDCFPCPALEVRRTIDALPPELLTWRRRHPAVEAVAPLLPKDRRVAGITVIDATPGRVQALQALFEAGKGGNK
ncbi:MAG: hypothetical protein CVU59_02705 [Deltaproteobacteria bacterium HGW-Deltaproteobacteria-17]|nr:MAG: hypothetical protein CVU59_02705 [Deltaproteobacteria bacterium HGW-Deltaproteobacteria-17]